MNNCDMNGLRGMIEQLPTQQLDEMLHQELLKRPIDGASVRLIMDVLEQRHGETPIEMNSRIEAAWQKYQSNAPTQRPAHVSMRSWPVRIAAAIVAIAALLFAALPQGAEAEGLWERLTRWTDSIFEFFAPGDAKRADEEYVFRTDNPGLQQVYDTVTELGVTVPVVPMWLPDDFELVECKIHETQSKLNINAVFMSSGHSVILDISIRNTESLRQYSKDEKNVHKYEVGGVTHTILRNRDWWTAAWNKDQIECTIAIDCQEETLYKILDTIYTMEDD